MLDELLIRSVEMLKPVTSVEELIILNPFISKWYTPCPFLIQSSFINSFYGTPLCCNYSISLSFSDLITDSNFIPSVSL